MTILAAAALLVSLASAGAPAPFDCPVPSGWSAASDEASTRMTGPFDENGVTSLIVVRYYAPGDKTFESADAYVTRQTAPPLFSMPGKKTEPVATIRVSGRKAKRVVKTDVLSVPPNSLKPKEVPTRAEHVVVPGKSGFYVLLNDAPASLAKQNRAAFKAVLAGFKPKL